MDDFSLSVIFQPNCPFLREAVHIYGRPVLLSLILLYCPHGTDPLSKIILKLYIFSKQILLHWGLFTCLLLYLHSQTDV